MEPRSVRGVVSNGMLCSAAELETAEESDGILELDPSWPVGAPAKLCSNPMPPRNGIWKRVPEKWLPPP